MFFERLKLICFKLMQRRVQLLITVSCQLFHVLYESYTCLLPILSF